jgi:hypothetical protein
MMRLLRTLLGFLKWIYWLQAAGTKLSSKSLLMQILTVIFAWDWQWLHIVSMERYQLPHSSDNPVVRRKWVDVISLFSF